MHPMRRGAANALPPASPAPNDDDDGGSAEVTVFLVGAYAKYNWPYVWVSTRQQRRWGGAQ